MLCERTFQVSRRPRKSPRGRRFSPDSGAADPAPIPRDPEGPPAPPKSVFWPLLGVVFEPQCVRCLTPATRKMASSAEKEELRKSPPDPSGVPETAGYPADRHPGTRNVAPPTPMGASRWPFFAYAELPPFAHRDLEKFSPPKVCSFSPAHF